MRDRRSRDRGSATSSRGRIGLRPETGVRVTLASSKRAIQDMFNSVYEADHVTVDPGLAAPAA